MKGQRDRRQCVIVGASHAGVSLAVQLRRAGWADGIRLLGAEEAPPYQRPPLSKGYLAGRQEDGEFALRSPEALAGQNIELTLGARAVAVHTADRQLELADGSYLPYAKLALCTGARPRRLPGVADDGALLYLRDLADARRLRARLQAGAESALIIGGGYIGLEIAAVLRGRGMAVTVLERERRILSRVTGPELSAYLTDLHRRAGVRIVTGQSLTVDTATSERGCVVTGADGTPYEADVAVVGIGIEPRVELAADCGAEVGNGIMVDEWGATSIADVYGAGDCANFPSALFGRRLRLESVQNATDQARAIAAGLLGGREPYDPVPWFWSDQYQAKLQMAGLSAGFDTVLARGNPDAASGEAYALFYLREGRIMGVDCVNSPRAFAAARLLISRRATLAGDLPASLESDVTAAFRWS